MAILEIRNLTHFFGGLRAVCDFNLSLQEGEVLGLIGPNGAGKTTVFNLVSGFYQPTEGDICFRDKNIVGLRPHGVTALGMARTFQNIRLWNTLTVFENLCISQHSQLGYGTMATVFRSKAFRTSERRVRKTADEILDILSLQHYSNEYPKNLPYGLQRRIEIGRALAIRPHLLLLDEPAAGMNPGEVDQLIDLIKWIRDKFRLTIWLIEHHMRVVMNICERIEVMDFGKTIARGTPEEIRQDRKVIQAYLGDAELIDA